MQAETTRAVIDVGSNTIEVLVARCLPENLETIDEQTTMLRLGEDVDEDGKISDNKIKKAVETIKKYKDLAQKHGAEQIIAIATEATREASNKQEFQEKIKSETGLELHIISGEAEAALDYFGTTYSPGAPRDTGVLDVGGGSTELVLSRNNHITWLTSVPFGSGTIQDRYLPSDPPTSSELNAASSYLDHFLETLDIAQKLPALIVTGSSASALLKLAKKAFKLDEQEKNLSYEDLSRCVGLLSALPAQEVAKRYEQSIERARVLAAGAVVIQAVMRYLNQDTIAVSSHGVREGILLMAARYGDNWLDEVNRLAGQAAYTPGEQHSDAQNERQESFAAFGRDTLPKYGKKFLKWSDDVCAGKDVEAVHKMRVASRRLRASLDAFEGCSNPKKFKKINRRVKKLADQLGLVRDTDVMISGLQDYLHEVSGEEQIAGVKWLVARLDEYHSSEEQNLRDDLSELDEGKLKQQIQSCIPKGVASDGQS
ncbi:MAG TPA: CHAD domain-containing protein [Ktedonobacteraceae bacterium]|jgi:exopolyphosphatase/pppGpp-phosphohydrolase|nr:CHAD domain-containing protein [Ktedonobacteraceae bacterium]